MGRTVSYAPGYAPNDDDQYDPLVDDFVSRERTYLHFDRPLNESARQSMRATEHEVLSHAFWPLLAFKKAERRVKRDKKTKVATFKEKIREIKFCSHQDAALLERYASWLAGKYEQSLGARSFARSVLAYRRGVGNNIQQAKELFDEIRTRGDVIAVALDISGFFDHIRHDVLLRNLKSVLGVGRLSPADHKVFRRLTRYEWVEADQIEERIRGKRRVSGRICDAYQFRSLVRRSGDSLVKVNVKDFGVPQGTPLSGLYANISLIEFDQILHGHFGSLGATYRRYSDDIAIVLPITCNVQDQVDIVQESMREIGLSLSEAKTEICIFKATPLGLQSDKPFQYLGFTFDGEKTLIRQSSLNRYHSKMKSGVLAKVLAAKKNNIPSNAIYMRELFRKYTHFGRYRNFPRYAYRAAHDLEAPEIRSQVANHFNVFKEVVRVTIEAIY